MAKKCFAHSVMASAKVSRDRNWNNHMKSLVKNIKRKMLEAAKKYGGSGIRIETNNHYLLSNCSSPEDVENFQRVLNDKYLIPLGLYARVDEGSRTNKNGNPEEFYVVEVSIPHHVAVGFDNLKR